MKKIWLVIMVGFLLAGIQSTQAPGIARNNLGADDWETSSCSMEPYERDDRIRLLFIGNSGSGSDSAGYAVGGEMILSGETLVVAALKDSVRPRHVVFVVCFAVIAVWIIRSAKKAAQMKEDDMPVVWA